MRKCWLSMLCLSFVVTPLFAQEGKAPPASGAPETAKDRSSYAIGRNVGQSLMSQGLDDEIVNPLMLAQGIIDALTGAKSALSEAEEMEAMRTFQQTMQAKQQQMQAEQQQLGTAAKQKGEAFLAQNAAKPGVKTLPSGLQYRVIKKGSGASPEATDTVKVHYHGTFIDGKKFDSSVDRGEPVEFPVKGVIPGWTEALQLMKVGSKWQLVIPSKLAYGAEGRPGIPPNSVLVFEVELLEIL